MNHQTPNADQTRSYPLAFLFVVSTFAATLVGLIGPSIADLAAGRTTAWQFATRSLGTAVATMLVGGVVGLYHHRRIYGFSIGAATGFALGLILGPTMASTSFKQIFVASLGGSFFIVVLSLIYAIKRSPQDLDPTNHR